jgi:hypothetical protein
MPKRSVSQQTPIRQYGGEVVFTDRDRAKVKRVLDMVVRDMVESESTEDMMREFGMIVKYVLSNRRIRRELEEQDK